MEEWKKTLLYIYYNFIIPVYYDIEDIIYRRHIYEG